MLRTMYRTLVLVLLLGLSADAMAQERVEWKQLAEVEFEGYDDQGMPTGNPTFPEELFALDGQTVKLSGFMIPLDFSEMQTSFLISAFPGDGCYFHMPGGPDSIAEIQAEEGVEFSYDTVEVEGKFVLLKDDPYGLLYKIIDARPVGN